MQKIVMSFDLWFFWYNYIFKVIGYLLIVDPLVMDIGPLHKPLHFYKDRSQAPKVLIDANQKILEADAFLMVSAEYNHSIPPALSNLMDHFPGSSFGYRPSGIVCYSPGELSIANLISY